MLVLSRKAGERIVIGDSITITVSEVHGQTVRIGVTAPSTINIRREEVQPQPCRAAAESSPSGRRLQTAK